MAKKTSVSEVRKEQLREAQRRWQHKRRERLEYLESKFQSLKERVDYTEPALSEARKTIARLKLALVTASFPDDIDMSKFNSLSDAEIQSTVDHLDQLRELTDKEREEKLSSDPELKEIYDRYVTIMEKYKIGSGDRDTQGGKEDIKPHPPTQKPSPG